MAGPNRSTLLAQLHIKPGSTDDIRAQRAFQIIEEATKGFKADIDYVSLIPLVVEHLDTMKREDLVTSVARKLGADTATAPVKPNSAADPFAAPGSASATGAAATSGVPAPGATPLDVTHDLVGHITAVMPKATDPQYQGTGGSQAYLTDYSQWIKNLGDAVTTQQALAEANLGIIKLPNGQMLFSGDINKLSPQEQAQVIPIFQQQNIDAANAYTKLLGDYGLEDYKNAAAATTANNAAKGADFTDSMAAFNDKLDIAKNGQTTAADRIKRMLDGDLESRTRAKFVQDTFDTNAGLMGPEGKTSFSGNDLGGAIAGLAKIAGLNPGMPLLQFTGQRPIDPQGQLNMQDQQLGVGGRLPEIPDLGITPDMIPQAPTRSLVPPPPKRPTPIPPVLPPVPVPNVQYGNEYVP